MGSGITTLLIPGRNDSDTEIDAERQCPRRRRRPNKLPGLWCSGGGAGSVATALGGAERGFASITAGQWVTAVIAATVAFGSAAGLTYAVPNRPK